MSGGELLNGIRDYALDRFGPMTMTLMDIGISTSVEILETLSSILSTMGFWDGPKMIPWMISREATTSKKLSKIPFLPDQLRR